MQPSKLNKRILLYERASKLDSAGTGQDVGLWRPIARDANPWAMVRPVAGSEQFTADQVVATRVLEFTIWWRLDVELRGVEMAIVYDGRAFTVTDVAELGNREGLVLTATARAEAMTFAPGVASS